MSGQTAVFNALKGMLTGHSADLSFAEIAANLGMREGAVKVAMYRLRRRYAAQLREEIGQTVCSPEEVEDEVRRLFQVFA